MIDSSFLCHSCRFPLAGLTDVPLSPIPHLLGTNKFPSEAEARAIRESIAAVQLDISQKDTDIAHARLVLDQLIEERKALKSYENEHAPFLTAGPARRLPAEIWSDIFFYCLPTMVNSAKDFVAFSPRNAPALLLRVCHDWTTIALSSPRLWSLIDLSTFDLPWYSRYAETLVQTWLKRSQQALLSVNLDTYSLTHNQMISFSETPATRTVLEQSYRWRAAKITLFLALVDMFLPLKNNLPALEELHLKFDDTRTTHVQLRDVDFFWNTPKLCRVAIYQSPPLPITDIKLPWTQLTHFSFRQGQSITVLLTLLRLAPNLLSVDWILAHDWDPHSDPMKSSIVRHSRLCNLSISIIGDPGPSFDRLFLPSLRTLSILSILRTAFRLPLAQFLSRNGRSLERLELHTSDIQGPELIAFLEAMPSISHLSLVIRSSPSNPRGAVEELLQMLYCATPKRAGGDVVMLPKMRTIKIECNSWYGDKPEVKVGKFIDMVESRWRMLPSSSHLLHQAKLMGQDISRIESASLLLRGLYRFTADPAYRDRVQKLKAEGLSVQVSLGDDCEL